MLVAGGKVVDDSVQLLLDEVELQRVGGVGGRGDLGTRTVLCIIRTMTFKLKTVQKNRKMETLLWSKRYLLMLLGLLMGTNLP